MTDHPATQLNPNAPVYTATPPINPSGSTVQPPTTLSLYADSNKTVLLQTAVAEVANPRDPSRTLKVGIVFDGGSQKLYLTQRVIAGFGSLLKGAWSSLSTGLCRCLDETLKVDLLIGSDFYWEFVTGKTIQGENYQ